MSDRSLSLNRLIFILSAHYKQMDFWIMVFTDTITMQTDDCSEVTAMASKL